MVVDSGANSERPPRYVFVGGECQDIRMKTTKSTTAGTVEGAAGNLGSLGYA